MMTKQEINEYLAENLFGICNGKKCNLCENHGHNSDCELGCEDAIQRRIGTDYTKEWHLVVEEMLSKYNAVCILVIRYLKALNGGLI